MSERVTLCEVEGRQRRATSDFQMGEPGKTKTPDRPEVLTALEREVSQPIGRAD